MPLQLQLLLATNTPGFVQCDSVFPVDLPFRFRRDVTHLFGVSSYAEILPRYINASRGVSFRIGRNWRLLGEDDLGGKQQKGQWSELHQ